MMFDRYKKFLDRRGMRYGFDDALKDSIKDADRAAHFDCGEVPFERLADDLKFPDEFFMPFPTVAVEYFVPENGHIVIQFWRRDESEPGYNDRYKDYYAANVMIFGLDGRYVQILKGWVRLRTKSSIEVVLYSNCTYEVSSGKCLEASTTDPELHREGSAAMSKQQEIRDSQSMLTFIAPALLLIEKANSPANWVVEVKDEHARIVKRAGKKVEQVRTRYIVVPDRDLNRVVRLPNEGGDLIERAPHRRRAHWRRLNSERYRFKRGQKVLVKESWVGPKESVHGGERYTVLTSLPGRAS